MAELEPVVTAIAAAPLLGTLLLYATFVLTTLLCLPASGLLVLLGAVAGVGPGAVAAVLGTLTSATLARVIGRGRWGAPWRRFVQRHPRLELVRRVVEDGGWRLVLLIRASPVLPLGLTNWAFAFVRVPLPEYLLATGAATLPAKLMWLNLGATGRESASLIAHPEQASLAQWALFALGLAATIGTVALLHRLTARRVEAELARFRADAPPPPSVTRT